MVRFRVFIETLIEEQYVSVITIAQNDYWLRYGVTDIAILEVSRLGYAVITDDSSLTNLLKAHGHEVYTITK
mgnify:CR=1 FL=1